MPRIRYTPTLWPTLAAIAGVAIAVWLGQWQLGRGNEKAALDARLNAASSAAVLELPAQSQIKTEDYAWRRVEARGRFAPQYGILLDNRVLRGAIGYHVVMPLQIGASGPYVLVNRGWVAAAATRDVLPQIATPRDELRVTGLAVVPSKRFVELSPDVVAGRVWENLDLERYRAAFPITVLPVIIQQYNDVEDGLKREWRSADLGIGRHYSYAGQWFLLGATILIFYLVTHVKKSR